MPNGALGGGGRSGETNGTGTPKSTPFLYLALTLMRCIVQNVRMNILSGITKKHMRGYLRSCAKYGTILAAGTILFFFLHFLGNQLPYETAIQRFSTAFARENLGERHHYHNSDDLLYSARALVGTEHFIECQIARVILGGSARASKTGTGLKRAIIVQAVRPTLRNDGSQCIRLKRIVAGEEYTVEPVKTRYLWGYKALYAILLHHFSVFEIREMAKVLTYFAYLVLALAIFGLSRKMFLILSPVIVFGFFFSAIRYFHTLGNALGYLWALMTAIMLVQCIKRDVSMVRIRCMLFIAGMVSAYVWFLDGHLLMSVLWIASITYFGMAVKGHSIKQGYTQVAKSLLLFASGFGSCYVVNQLIKVAFHGWQRVIVDTFWLNGIVKTISRRTADLDSTETWYRVFGSPLYYFHKGAMLGVTPLTVLVTLSAILAAICATIAIIYAIRRRYVRTWDIICPYACMVWSGIALLFRHDNVYQQARFFFLFLAFGWVSAFAIWQNVRR